VGGCSTCDGVLKYKKALEVLAPIPVLRGAAASTARERAIVNKLGMAIAGQEMGYLI